MESSHVSTLLELLSSTKLKERNKGLDELTTLLKQNPSSLQTKHLSTAIDALIDILETERVKYDKVFWEESQTSESKVTAAENRLSAASYVLRLLVEKTCDKFRAKHMRLLILMLPEIMISSRSSELLRPVSQNILCALNTLILSDVFQLKFELHQWINLVEKASSYLSKHLEFEPNDKNVSYLINMLLSLISIDTIGIQDVTSQVLKALVKYMENTRNENANTKSVLQLVNRFIIKTHLTNFMCCLKIMEVTMKHVINVQRFANDNVEYELAIFNILLSDVIFHTIPEVVGRPESFLSYDPSHLLLTFQDFLIINLSLYRPTKLSLGIFEFKDIQNRIEWFELKDFQLSRDADHRYWLQIYGLTKMTSSYYEILNKEKNMNSSLFKKRKVLESMGTIIKTSRIMVDFIENCLESSSLSIQLFGLQLSAFHTSMVDVGADYCKQLRPSVLRKFEDDTLIGWACLASIPLYCVTTTPCSEDTTGKLFRSCLPLVKSVDLCRVSCTLLTTLMKFQGASVMRDQLSLHQIYDVYELSELNGPNLVVNEAFAFWEHLHIFGKTYRSKSQESESCRIFVWLLSKWNQVIILKPEQSDLHYFIAWLSGRSPRRFEQNTFTQFSDFDETYYPHWQGCRSERNFLLHQKDTHRKHYTSSDIQPNVVVEKSFLLEVLSKISDVFERLEGGVDNQLRWVCECVRIIDHFVGDRDFMDFIDDFKHSVKLAVINLNTAEGYSTPSFPFREILALRNVRHASYFMLSELDANHLVSDLKNHLVAAGRHNNLLKLDNFESSRKSPEIEALSSIPDYSSRKYTQTLIGQATEFILNMTEYSSCTSADTAVRNVLDFLTGFPTECAIQSVYPLIEFLSTSGKKLSTLSLEQLTQFLGSTLLSPKFNSSSISMIYLASYLDYSRDLWLTSSGSLLNKDCNDVLDWMTDRFEDNSFSSTTSLLCLSQLMLHMLKFHDLSHGSVKGGKQRIFGVFLSCLKRLPSFMVVSGIRELQGYMSKVSFNNQIIVFSAVTEIFETPQESMEKAAFYALTLVQLSQISYSHLLNSIFHMLRYVRYAHVRFYLEHALLLIASLQRVGSPKALFHLCRFDLINFWFDESLKVDLRAFEHWDISLFGFDSIESFVANFYQEIAGFSFSKGCDSAFVIEDLMRITLKQEKTLFQESVQYSIPLSYLSSGIEDRIEEICQEQLGNQFESILSDVCLENCYWLLRFADLGLSREIKATFEKFYPQSTFPPLLFEVDLDKKCQFSLHVGLQKVIKLFKKQVAHHNMKERELRFLLTRQMLDLSSATSIEEKIHVLRRVKSLLILFNESVTSCPNLISMVQTLSTFMNVKELRNEIPPLICCILSIYRDFKFNAIDMFPAIFAHLFLLQDGEGSFACNSLREALIYLVSNDLSRSKYSTTWGICVDILRGRKSEHVYSVDELLDDTFCDSNRLLLVSQLFSYQPKPQPLNINFKFSDRVVKNLITTELPYDKLSENFYLWKGYYIGSFFLKNAIIPRSVEISSDWSEVENILPGRESFSAMITALYESLKRAKGPKLTYIFESVIGYIIKAFSEEAVVRYQDSEKYSELVLKFAPISHREFVLLHGDSTHGEGIENFLVSEHLSTSSSYGEWLFSLFSSLTVDIARFMSSSFALRVAAKEDQNFAESTILHMFLLLVSRDSRFGVKIISYFLQSFVESNNMAALQDFNRKAIVVLKVFFLIRAAAKLCITDFNEIYSRLSLFSFYHLAMKIEQMEFAYMILEEFYLESTEKLDLSSLSVIFEGLGDNDLMYALPAEPSLAFAVNQVNQTQPRSMKSFMFNNSKYDVDILTNGGADTSELLKSVSTNGFKGLAEVIGEASGTLDGSDMDEIYQWSMELGKWDLPIPDTCNSKSKALYSFLKHTQLHPSNSRALIDDVLPKFARGSHDFGSPGAWASILSIITTFAYFMNFSKEIESLATVLEFLRASDKKFLRNSDFQDYQLTMKVRHIFLNQLIQGEVSTVNAPILSCCKITELAKYARLSRESGAFQESITTAMILDRNTDPYDQTHMGQMCRRLAVFEAAQVLWLQNDNTVSISMLKSLLPRVTSEIEASDAIGPLHSFLDISNVKVKSLLAKWVSISRQETAESIYESYVSSSQSDISTVKDYKERSDIFYRFGEFCYEQVRRLDNDMEMEERQKRFNRGFGELGALLEITKNLNLSERERKEARKHYNRLKLQVEQDKEILDNLSKQLQLFIWKALHYYLNTMVYNNEKDDDVMDKFCGLWFQFSDNNEVNSSLYQEIGSIPSFKFLPWINQMTSRLGTENTPFQKTLQLTLKRVLFKLPYESLYPLLSMKLHKNFDSAKDPSISGRVKTVEKLLKELQNYDNGSYIVDFVNPIEEFCDKCVDLACAVPPKKSTHINLESLKIGNYWLKMLNTKGLPLPTVPFLISCSADGRKPRPVITHIEKKVDISSSGLSLPKIVTFYLSDGSRRKVLMKGSNDDLRQDAIMEQVFKQVNKILVRNKQTRKYDLRIRTYEVVPLGPQAGLIEFVSNSISLHEVLSKLHKNDRVSFDQARKAMKLVQSKSNDDRVREYNKITEHIKPQLRRFFFDSFRDPQQWLEAKLAYTRGVVTTSIIGHILGLGDRHLNNILLDKSTGEPIHIDLGVAFDQGRLLPIPELVPFRLTRDMINGFGVIGVEGTFRKNCERVYAVLRSDYERVMSVLNVLKWDPLYSWVVSPLRKQKLQANLSEDSNDSNINITKQDFSEDNNESLRALKGVQDKLLGNGLSVEATVQELIQQATDVNNLAVIYMGWSPFY